MSQNKGRILFITYSAPPLTSAHSLKCLYLTKYLTEFGWQLDVLTILPSTHSPYFELSSIKKLPESVRIFRTCSGLHKIYYDKINHLVNKPQSVRSKKGGKPLVFNIHKIIGAILNLLIPDVTIFWYPFGVIQGIKLIRRSHYDIIISSGPPFTAHLIAYTIRKLVKIPWIINNDDPWVFSPLFAPLYKHNKIRFRMEHKIEENILKLAEALIVVTEETKQNYLENYSFLTEEKVKVMSNGVDYDEFQSVSIEKPKKFRILYTGSILKTEPIRPFFDALKKLNERKGKIPKNVEVIFTGNIKDEYKQLVLEAKLSNIVSFRGFVPLQEVISLIMGADVLLLLGHKGGLQVPVSKLLHYLAARRPILCVKGDDRDASAKLLQGLNRGVIVSNDSKDIHSAIIKLYTLSQKQELDEAFDLAEIPSISWRSRVERLNQVCEAVLAR